MSGLPPQDPFPPRAEGTAAAGGASALALDTCRLIGANPSGPVGARLIEACDHLPPGAALASGVERDALVARLIDGATNRETYFFRDRRQLALMASLLGDWAAAHPDTTLALWSAGCATGEEAYSLAITLRRLGRNVSVLGTDISRSALAVAREALYRTGPMSPCRQVGPEDDADLPPTEGGRRRVADPIRAVVRFAEHNILKTPPAPLFFDAVVCRNVLIYMDDAARRVAFAALAAAVRPGGLLLLGPGDSAPPTDPQAFGFTPLFRDGAGLFVKGSVDDRPPGR